MTSFAQRCRIHDAERERELSQTTRLIEDAGLELVRVGWCDLHGMVRGKTLVAAAAERAMREHVRFGRKDDRDALAVYLRENAVKR